MISDARELPDDADLRAPVVILGAGAAGISLALELAAAGVDSLVIEGGGLELDERHQALFSGTLSGEPMGTDEAPLALADTHLRYLGGTTNHWSGHCRPFSAIDFERRDDLALSGWPITREDLDPYYERALGYLDLEHPQWDAAWWDAEHDLGPVLLDTEAVATEVFQVTAVQFRPRYQASLEADGRIRVLLHLSAVELRTDGGSAVTGVRCRTLDGREHQVIGDAVVVALGGVESPRLLLASTGDRPAGLGNQNDLVGRYFCEHLNSLPGAALLNRPEPQIKKAFAGIRIPSPSSDPAAPVDYGVKAALTLTDAARRRDGLLGMEAQFYAVPFPDDYPQVAGEVGWPEVAALQAGQGATPGTVVLLTVVSEQELNPSSRVTLLTDRDELGMQRVELHWSHTALDRHTIVTGLGVMGREMGAAGAGRMLPILGGYTETDEHPRGSLSGMIVDPAQRDPEHFHVGIGFHHMCTTRMAASEHEGVVDADLRVHGVDNLYVASSAAFGTAGAVTPTYTVVALALRLADHLSARIGRS